MQSYGRGARVGPSYNPHGMLRVPRLRGTERSSGQRPVTNQKFELRPRLKSRGGTGALFARRRLFRRDLRPEAFGLGRIEVELDLDAVRVVHEKLVERLAVRAPFVELYLVAAQVGHGALEPLCAEGDVVGRAGSGTRVLPDAPEIGLLGLARVLRARADVHDILALEIHPAHRKPEVRVPAFLHAEYVAVPVARALHVVGGNQIVLDMGQRHCGTPVR